MATRCQYLTARCPYGCEAWLHPKAVLPHRIRCRHHPWTDERRPTSEVLVNVDQADEAIAICPPEILFDPRYCDGRMLERRNDSYGHLGITKGLVLRSPLEGVTARRWWTVVRTAAHRGKPTDEAYDHTAFEQLEQDLDLTDHFTTCQICGDAISGNRLLNHQRTNAACQFLAATNEVNSFWALGYRDPYSLRNNTVPLTWSELNATVALRNRLHVVAFKLWTAVLISR